MFSTFDTLVVGAGAAGLAAASKLASAGRSVCVLEARDRLGGRVHTKYDPSVPIPLELGAEFIHGRPDVTLALLRRANSSAVDIAHTRWTAASGTLNSGDSLFDEMKKVLAALQRPTHDLSFDSFLKAAAAAGKLQSHIGTMARMLVEGFDAADAERVSTYSILDEWNGDGGADAPALRPMRGYGALIAAMADTLPPDKVQVQLNCIVQEVHWTRGAVRIAASRFGEPVHIEAPQAIIALPLGVLQLPPDAPGGIRFTPALQQKQGALSQLASGPVIKLLLHFRSAFWEHIDEGRYRDGTFFQNPKTHFSTVWTSLPLRTNVLVAWAGGPKATGLAGLSRDEMVRKALASLESTFGTRSRCRDTLQSAHLHDWQADRFACGAYSYVLAGGNGARAALAAPLDDTLFFAGEASDTEGEAGTVAGALQSGERAAEEAVSG